MCPFSRGRSYSMMDVVVLRYASATSEKFAVQLVYVDWASCDRLFPIPVKLLSGGEDKDGRSGIDDGMTPSSRSPRKRSVSPGIRRTVVLRSRTNARPIPHVIPSRSPDAAELPRLGANGAGLGLAASTTRTVDARIADAK